MPDWFGRRRNRNVGASSEHVAALQQASVIDIQEVLATARAFRLFVMAPTLDETLRLLQVHQEALTSENALMACKDMIAQFQHSGETELAEELERRLHLLEDTRRYGVEKAWQRFLQARKIRSVNIPEIIMAFLEAPDWYASRRILEEKQSVLLSDKAITFFRQKVDSLRFHPDNVEVVCEMEQYLQILEDAKAWGTDKAWEKFADRRFQEFLRKVPSDPNIIQLFLFLYEQDPDEFARQMGATRDDPVLKRVIEHFRKMV